VEENDMSVVELVEAITDWCTSSNIWKARSACVGMLKWAGKDPLYDGFEERLISTAAQTIKNQERFVQLGTGALLTVCLPCIEISSAMTSLERRSESRARIVA
jgi:hypothetical protein